MLLVGNITRRGVLSSARPSTHGRCNLFDLAGPIATRASHQLKRSVGRSIGQRQQCRQMSGLTRFLGNVDSTSVIYGLIGANCGVFLLWKTSPYFALKHFTCSPDGIVRNHRYHTLLTCTFSHVDIWHLAVNMLGLFYFGGQAAIDMGPRRFLGMYLAAGAVSSIAQTYRDSINPYTRNSVLLGASGAVNSAIMWGVLCRPTSTVLIWGLVPVPMALFGFFIMFQDLWGAVSTGGGGMPFRSSQIGYTSHLVGAGVGAATWVALRRAPRRFF
uniref:Peptidase S54 rhomboid domain-containing protein n=1 Tax=Mucochytrium quahogii TaxID=96639 RepID=A0A7S2S4Q5_9STRA|mmetsp:Transcript_5296/g.8159  ORF Transcript_5296/g.8159 Transcript_5296/m.8159 type:complete len:272 (-) Transcript_5296:1292-2107(-)